MPRQLHSLALLCALLLCTAHPSLARVMDGQAIVHQAGNANMCAITFDDGPSQYTAQLLDSLQYENIPATFFVLGRQVERHPDLILRMVSEGHEVGSHSYSHPNFRKLNPAEQLVELSRTCAMLTELGATPVNFRPPYGKYSEITVELAQSLGMSIVLWSSDSQDWKRRPADYAQMRTVTGRPSLPGKMNGIFLFHDIRKATVEDVHRIIGTLRAGGCQRFVTVSDYMNSDLTNPPMYTALPPANEPVSAANGALNNSQHPAPVAETGVEEDDLMAQSPPVITPPAHATQTVDSESASVPLARSSEPWSWFLFEKSGT